MKAKELLNAGQLTAAIEQLNQEVRSHPTDSHLRTFLFELLCYVGGYQRAERQLDVIGMQEATAEVGVQVYRNILAADGARRRLFSEGLRPGFLFDPPPFVNLPLEVATRLREGQPIEAIALLEESNGTRPHLNCAIDFGSRPRSNATVAPLVRCFCPCSMPAPASPLMTGSSEAGAPPQGFQGAPERSAPYDHPAGVSIDPQSRADALRRLAAVAAYFRRTEPHSPVSYLVQRAVRWGEMPSGRAR
jgi:hypothetical protein